MISTARIAQAKLASHGAYQSAIDRGASAGEAWDAHDEAFDAALQDRCPGADPEIAAWLADWYARTGVPA